MIRPVCKNNNMIEYHKISLVNYIKINTHFHEIKNIHFIDELQGLTEPRIV